MGEVIKSQQTELFWATAASVVNKATAISGIAGLGGAREPVDTTDLEDETDGTVIAGIARPGPVTANFNVRRGELAHRALLALRDSGELVSWGVYSSGAATVPTAVAGVLQAASGRVSGHFMGYVSDVNIEAAGNNIWKGTISIQRSGKITWNLMTPEEEIAALFAAGEQGAWFDPSDMSTLFQDAAGTIPVSALEQPVGRMLDKSGRGNHATQATAGARPVLSARFNAYSNSALFSAASWIKTDSTVTDNAEGTSAKLTEGVGNTFHAVGQAVAVAGIQQTLHFRVKAAGRTIVAVQLGAASSRFDVAAGTMLSQGTGHTAVVVPASGMPAYFDLFVTCVPGSGAATLLMDNGTGLTYTGDGVSGVLIARAQLNLGAAGPYQRTGVGADYDTSGFPAFLRFDGAHSMATASFSLAASGKVTAIAGMQKNSDAAAGILCEFSASVVANPAAFALLAPASAAANLQFAIRGAVAQMSATAVGLTSPYRAVMAGLGDTSASQTLRINGVPTTAGGSPGGGLLGTYPLYIGRRGGASFPFNGNLYGLIVLGRATTGPELSAAETFMATRTGVAL